MSFGIGSVRQVPIKSTLVLQKNVILKNLQKKVQIMREKKLIIFKSIDILWGMFNNHVDKKREGGG